MLPRPRIRLPLWSVPLIVVALYVVRSLLHGSWQPDLPMDLVTLVLVVVVVAVVARLRAIVDSADDEDEDDPLHQRGASRSDAEGPTN